MSDDTLPRISSLAAPTEADKKAFDALSDDDKRAFLIAEIEKGLEGNPRRVTANDVVERGKARLGLDDG